LNPDLEKILKGIHRDKPKVIDIPIVVEADAPEDQPSSEESEDLIVVEGHDVTGINTEEFDDADRPMGNVGGDDGED